MPARRSRTAQWKRCLNEVYQRGGTLEIAIARRYDPAEPDGRHVVWRVRILELTDDQLVVEQPVALGQPIRLETGLEVVGILSIGQNRWMFQTSILGPVQLKLGPYRIVSAVRLAVPRSVRRCQRRNYYRVETANLTLPDVEVWPLLDPKSVLVAERANELQFQAEQSQEEVIDWTLDPSAVMPEVGPKFTATLLNLGGGGVGLQVRPEDAQILSRQNLFWVRLSLKPELMTPVCSTVKLAHTHLESTQNTYAGLAFDFTFNPAHQKFVVEQISRYVALQQRDQLRSQSAHQKLARSA